MEMTRLKTASRGVEEVASSECRIQPDYQVSVFDPQVAKRHMEEVKKHSSLFSSRMDLLEARVFGGEILDAFTVCQQSIEKKFLIFHNKQTYSFKQ